MKFTYDENKPFWLNHAHATIITDDLDPVYVGVHRSMPELGLAKTHRFLVAMSLYYHVGLACQIADASDDQNFWELMQANYEGTKRGIGRRYFRGKQGQLCLDYLKKTYKTPSDFLMAVYRPKYSELMVAFDPVPAFGPYFVWKIQDFFDRILGMPVQPDTCILHLPSVPVKGAMLVHKEMGFAGGKESIGAVFRYMEKEIHNIGLMAPPLMDRLVDIREIETTMCGLEHYYNGSDYVGKDLVDKYEALNGYGETAAIIQSHIPKPVPRDFFTPPADVVARLGVKLSKKALPQAPVITNNLFNFMALA